MAQKKLYIGGIGPFLFDDADLVNDPDGDWAGETNVGIRTDSSVIVDAGYDFDIADYITGTASEIEVVDDGDDTVTIRGAGENTNTIIPVVISIQAGGVGAIGFQYKTQTLTLSRGIIASVSAQSGWYDI